MIAKGTNGSSFYGLLNYLLDEEKYPELILASENIFLVEKAALLARQFVQQAEQSKRISGSNVKPVWHFSLSLAPEDIPKINDWFLCDLAKEFARKMGFEKNQFVVIKHEDTIHPHIHLVVNRVGEDGKFLADRMMKKRAMEASIHLEEKYHLSRAKSKSRSVSTQLKPLKYAFKPGAVQLNRDIKKIVIRAISSAPGTLRKLNDKLWEAGIKLERLTREDKSMDVAFCNYTYLDNQIKKYRETQAIFNLSDIRKGYSLEQIAGEISAYLVSEQDKAIIRKNASAYLSSEPDVNAFVTSCMLNGIDMQKEDNISTMIASTKDEVLKESIQDKISNAFFSGAMLKQELFQKGRTTIEEEQVFHFTRKEVEIIGDMVLDQFYDQVFDSINMPKDISRKLAKTKKLNSDTIYLFMNSIDRESKLNYNPLKADELAVKQLLLLSGRGDQARNLDTDHQQLLQAIRTFKRFKTNDIDSIRFLARRGFLLQIEKSNIAVMNFDGKKMGLAHKLGLDELKRHGAIAKSMTHMDIKEMGLTEYDPDSASVYRALDASDVKEMRNIIIRDKVSMRLDAFDMRFIDGDFAPVIKDIVDTVSVRANSQFEKRGKTRR